MLTNFHSHTSFCDGNNTAEEMILAALERGFFAIGLSGHAYTPFDTRYCMRDTEGYIAEVKRLKEKYKGKIEVYLGTEEDIYHPVDRSLYDFVISSSHYMHVGERYLPIDSNYDYFKECLRAFDDDVLSLADRYYSAFCGYIREKKPMIVGHYDLITKFDEIDTMRFLNNEAYHRLAERYTETVADIGCLFEVNTGAISRGYRTAPYPHERLLRVLKKHGAGLILGSDSHAVDTLDRGFAEARAILKDIGFTHVYTLLHGAFTKDYL